MKIVAALIVPVITLGVSGLATSPASAHTPDISADCNGVHVGATAYDASMQNHWSVTIDGTTQSGTFGSSFDQTFPVPQDGTTVAWSAFVEAADGSYHGQNSGTVGPCGTPAVEDVCDNLPGTQPEGTPCTPPPDVQRAEQQELHGCDVAFAGTHYGAGHLAYDEQYTDTYVFNAQDNTWDLVTDTTATVANVHFTAWSIPQQVAHGCLDAPAQPKAEHSTHVTRHLDCDDQVEVTTTVATTTAYVYDASSNTWVLGQPVSHTTTSEHPAQPGQCDDVEVAPAQASSGGVPTAVDAGLAGAVPAAAPVSESGDSHMPALLLLAGVALSLVGLRRVRPS